MSKKIIIPYFPKGMKYATPLLFGAGGYLFFIEHPIWGLILIVLGVIILTTKYVTEINLGDKSYDDYLSFLWIPLNRDKKRFRHIDKIVVSRGNHSQTVNTRIQSRQMDWTDYTGTLILDNDKLDLVTHTNKKELLHALREFSDFLKVDVEDRTTTEHFWIDMTKY
ncbi:MAG TPA: hypothetical protein VF141_03270 [Chryseolinea sp.]